MTSRSARWTSPTVIAEAAAALVVAGAVAWLVYPVTTHGSRPHERMEGCIGSERQLALGLLMYAQDHDERLPSTTWMDAIGPYLKNDGVFRCTEVPESTPPQYGYAHNSLLLGVSTDKVSAPARKPLLYDSDDLSRNAAAPGLSGLANPPRHLRDRTANNIAYLDGHARSVPLP